jgi:hypothetical protein
VFFEQTFEHQMSLPPLICINEVDYGQITIFIELTNRNWHSQSWNIIFISMRGCGLMSAWYHDTQHNDIQHKGLICETQNNGRVLLCLVSFMLCSVLFCWVSFLLSVMLSVIYAECHLCWVTFMLSVIYSECHLLWVSFILSVIYSECHLFRVSFILSVLMLSVVMLSVIYAECHLCWVPFMLSAIYAACHLCWVSFNAECHLCCVCDTKHKWHSAGLSHSCLAFMWGRTLRREVFWRGRLGTVYLLLTTGLDLLLFILKILFTIFKKQATLIMRSTLLSLPSQ